MKPKDTIFGSKSEAKMFRLLDSHWKDHFNIYTNLPFANILTPEPKELTPKELDYFYKTSVDFVLCSERDKPLLAIEFDGIGHGFSKDGTYIAERVATDTYRKLKLEFKIAQAEKAGLPFVILSYPEIELLGEEESYAILDSIIGQFLVHRELPGRVRQHLGETSVDFESWPAPERDEYIQDTVISAEIVLGNEYDPIARLHTKYWGRCTSAGLYPVTTTLFDPPLPELKDLFDIEALTARVEAFEKVVSFGARSGLSHPSLGNTVIVRTIWLRNFTLIGADALSISRTIAEYLACKAACQVMDIPEESD